MCFLSDFSIEKQLSQTLKVEKSDLFDFDVLIFRHELSDAARHGTHVTLPETGALYQYDNTIYNPNKRPW